MTLLFRSVLLALFAAFSLPAAANSCYVSAETSGAVPPPVVTEKCFEYQGLEDNSIDWVCQDNEAIENSRREIRDSCPTGHFGICTAALTPETLANERATGTQADNGTLPTTVPKEARVVTYHYQASDRAQAKIDCESAGGEWSQ
ncbi:MAG TPA: hypothetical protein DHV63_13210 [Pseudomonas sp.]|nr:hypothetical protein [Pseudomonas sp.]